jgi:hypothetical protein
MLISDTQANMSDAKEKLNRFARRAISLDGK